MTEPDPTCPDCGLDPDEPLSHRDGCPRINNCGQIGPPWYDPPFHAWTTDGGPTDLDNLAEHYATMHGQRQTSEEAS